MGKKRRILLAGLVVAVIGGLVWAMMPSGPPNPVYDGHPVSWWVRHESLEDSHSPKMDPNALPYLIAALKTRDGPLHGPYRGVWEKMPPRAKLYLPVPVEAATVRILALNYLGGLGHEAEPAIPELLRVLKEDKHPDARFMAVYALALIGENDKRVTVALVAALKDQEPVVRDLAGTALKKLDPEAAVQAGVR